MGHFRWVWIACFMLFSLAPFAAFACVDVTLLEPDYVIDERNVSSRNYTLVQNRFNVLVATECTPLGREVVFVFVPTVSALYTLQTAIDGVDTVMSLVGADGCVLACNDDAVPTVTLNSRLVAQMDAGQRYTIVVEAYEVGTVGNISLSITATTTFTPTKSPSTPPTRLPTGSPITPPPAITGLDNPIRVTNFNELVNVLQNAENGKETAVVIAGTIQYPQNLTDSSSLPTIRGNRRIKIVGYGASSISALTMVAPALPRPIRIDAIGNASQPIGDFNGDGIVDFVEVNQSLAESTSVSIHLTPTSSTSQGEYTIVLSKLSFPTNVFAIGDITADGFDDFALCSFTECQFVMGGSAHSGLSRLRLMDGAQLKHLRGAGDVNGDGVDDFLLVYSNNSLVNTTTVVVLPGSRRYGTIQQAVDLRHDSASIIKQLSYNISEVVLTGAGDFNLDGAEDLVSALPTKGEVSMGPGALKIIGDPLYRFGESVLGGIDLNKDGTLDLAIGAPGYLDGRGGVYLVFSVKPRDLHASRHLIDEFEDVVLVYSSTDSVRNCGRQILHSDFDKDGLDDIVVMCDSVAYVVFGSRDSIVDSIPLDDLADGFNGLRIDLSPHCNKSTILAITDVDDDGFTDILLRSLTHQTWAVVSPGKARLGRFPFFVLSDSGRISVDGVAFIGSRQLAAIAAPTSVIEVTNSSFSVGGRVTECPLGSLNTVNGACAFCPVDKYCPMMNGQPWAQGQLEEETIAIEPVSFALPMDMYRVASDDVGNTLVVSYRDSIGTGPSLIGRFVTPEGHSFVRRFDITRGDVSVVRKSLTGLSGTFPIVFEVIAVADGRFLVLYSSAGSIVSKTIHFPGTVEETPQVIASLPLNDFKFQDDAFFTYSISDVSPSGAIALVLSFPVDSLQMVVVSRDTGKSWTTRSGLNLFPFAPTFPYHIIPESFDHDLTPSAFGGHMAIASSASPSVLGAVAYVQQFDSGIIHAAVLLASSTGVDSIVVGANLSLNNQGVYGLRMIAVPGQQADADVQEFIAVVNVEERLLGYLFTYRQSNRSSEWIAVGRVTKGNARVSYSTGMDFSSRFGKVVYENSGRVYVSEYLPSMRDWSNAATFSVNTSFIARKELRTADDFHVFIVRDNWVLIASLELLQVPTANQSSWATKFESLAAYAFEGVPIRSSLRSVGLFKEDSFAFECSGGAACPMGTTKPPSVESLQLIPSGGLALVDIVYPLVQTTTITLDNIGLETIHVRVELVPVSAAPHFRLEDRFEDSRLTHRIYPGTTLPVTVAIDSSSSSSSGSTFPSDLTAQLRIERSSGVVSIIAVQAVVQTLPVMPPKVDYWLTSAANTVDAPFVFSIRNPLEFPNVRRDNSGEDRLEVTRVKVGCGFPETSESAITVKTSPTSMPMTSSWSVLQFGFVLDLSKLDPVYLLRNSGWINFCLVVGLRYVTSQSSLAAVSLQTQGNVSVILARPCPPGSFSSSGTNENGCTKCPRGLYQPSSGSQSCLTCPSSVPQTLDLGAVGINECLPLANYFRTAEGVGKLCPLGANCSIPTDVETLRLLKGFWRGNSSQETIRRCRHPEYCLGSPERFAVPAEEGGRRRLSGQVNEVCRVNHTGVMCEGCDVTMVKRSGFCEQCTSETTTEDQGRFAGLVLGLLLLVALGFVLFLLMAETFVDAKSKDWAVSGMTKLKIILGLLQIVSGTVNNYPWVYPSEFRQFASAFGFLYLDMLHTLNYACAFSFIPGQQYTSLVVSTIMPLLVFVVIGICGGIVLLVHPENDKVRTVMREMCLFVLFLVYPGVSNTILRTFRCEYLEEIDQSVLWVEPAVECYDSAWGSYVAYAAVMVVVYIVLVPVVFLQTAVKAFKDRRKKPKSGQDTQPKSKKKSLTSIVVTDSFRDGLIWFECCELVRKILQIGLAIFLPTLPGQFLFELGVTVLFALWLIDWKPYITSRWDHFLAGTTQLCIYMIVLAGLLGSLETEGYLGRESPLVVDMATLNPWLFVIFFIPIMLLGVEFVYYLYQLLTMSKQEREQKRLKQKRELSERRRSTSHPSAEHSEPDRKETVPPPPPPAADSKSPRGCAAWCCSWRNKKPKLGWFFGDFDSDDLQDSKHYHVAEGDKNNHERNTHNNGVTFI